LHGKEAALLRCPVWLSNGFLFTLPLMYAVKQCRLPYTGLMRHSPTGILFKGKRPAIPGKAGSRVYVEQ
jgi:hypothetical protein